MQLMPIESAIDLPSCEIRKNGLIICGELNRETISRIAHTLNAFEQCGQWWWGDFLCAVTASHGETYDEGLRSISGYAYQTLATAKWVCSKFDISLRRENLSFGHHQAALEEADGDVVQAIKWLDLAEREKLSISHLRKAARSVSVTPRSTNPNGGGFNPMKWIDEGRAFYAKQPVEQWEPVRCQEFIADTDWVEEMRIKALERIK